MQKDNRRAGDHAHWLPTSIGLTKHGLSEKADAGQTERRKRLPVRGVDVENADQNDEEHGCQLDPHHRRIEVGAFGDALHEHDRHDRDDNHRRQIHDAGGPHELPRRSVVDDRRTGQRGGKLKTELGNHALKISRPAIGHRGRADRVLENQIPADHPGEDLAERGAV
jgi:hypothetical protein